MALASFTIFTRLKSRLRKKSVIMKHAKKTNKKYPKRLLLKPKTDEEYINWVVELKQLITDKSLSIS